MGMKTANYNIFDSEAIANPETKNSSDLDISQIYGFAIRASWTDTPTGTIKLQATVKKDPESTDWSDISGTSTTLGGAAGSVLYNIADAMYKCIRVQIDVTGGSTTNLTADIHTKGS